MTRMQRMRVELPAVIALGSNLGDREATLRQAVGAIGSIPGVVLTGASSIVETPAWKPDGVDVEAPSYLNAVVTARISITPGRLLDELNRIEALLGRERRERWGDRTLDLDVVTVGPITQNDERLTLPHPRAFERGFVLRPWLEVQPDAVLPGHGRVADLVESTLDSVSPFSAAPLFEGTRR